MPQKPPEVVEPVDYLYFDRERLAGFHTQLLGSGTPLESKMIENYKRSEASSGKVSVPPIFAGDMSNSDEHTTGRELRFDLAWLTALQTIDELDKRGYISDVIAGTPIGTLVRVHGFIQVVNLDLLREIWKPMLKLQKGSAAEARIDDTSLMEIAELMPHPIVVQMITREDPIGSEIRPDEMTTKNWGILSPQNFLSTPESFSLMNGGVGIGEYEMIANLEAGAMAEPEPNVSDIFGQADLFSMMLAMQQQIRKFFGRPSDSNGVTPLVISRKLRPRK